MVGLTPGSTPQQAVNQTVLPSKHSPASSAPQLAPGDQTGTLPSEGGLVVLVIVQLHLDAVTGLGCLLKYLLGAII